MSTSIAGPSQPNNGITPAHPLHPSSEPRRRNEPDVHARSARPPLPPPHILSTLVPDSPAFTDLMKIEQKLDWTLVRKKAEINDALGRPQKVSRFLRVFLSNTAHHQSWQNELDGDATTGQGIPGWVMRIEGRLLDSGNVRLDKTRPKFSTYIRSVVVELDNRTSPTYPEGNTIEWHASDPPVDGFEISRRGDVNVDCRILIHVAHSPERFRVLPPLVNLIGVSEGTRAQVMSAMWKLVKIAGAQDKEDASVIRPVGGIEQLTPTPIHFHQLPELTTRFLAHPAPIVLPYVVKVDQDFNLHSKCFDIPIEIDDPGKSKLSTIVASFEGEEGKEIAKLEDKVTELAYFARDTKQRRDFLESFASSPSEFIQQWLSAQSRDLDTMLGYSIGPAGNGSSVTEEDLRRSDLFNLPWVDEAITVHEASRMEMERRR